MDGSIKQKKKSHNTTVFLQTFLLLLKYHLRSYKYFAIDFVVTNIHLCTDSAFDFICLAFFFLTFYLLLCVFGSSRKFFDCRRFLLISFQLLLFFRIISYRFRYFLILSLSQTFLSLYFGMGCVINSTFAITR